MRNILLPASLLVAMTLVVYLLVAGAPKPSPLTASQEGYPADLGVFQKERSSNLLGIPVRM